MSRPDANDHHRTPLPTGPRYGAAIRLAVGLAHTVPGAELIVRRQDGTELVAANRLGLDLDLCTLRRLAVAAMAETTADRWLDVVAVGGTIEREVDGVWASSGSVPRRWFATLLRHRQVIEILEGLDTTDIGDDGIDVVLRPDPTLGITSVAMSAESQHLVDRLDELANRANAACIVEELIVAAQHTAHADLTTN